MSKILLQSGYYFYGYIGEKSTFVLKGDILHVGDIVEVSIGSTKSEHFVVRNQQQGFFIYGIAGDCNQKSGRIANWKVKIIKRFFELDGSEIHDNMKIIDKVE